MPSRREQIEAMLAEKPKGTMLRYMLAMELERDQEHERSLALFRELMSENYLPAFFRVGQNLVGLDRIDEARTALRDGIELARKQGDLRAAGEMSELLTSLGSQ